MTHYDKALEGKLAPYFKWHMIIFSSHFQTERDEGETFIYLFVWENWPKRMSHVQIKYLIQLYIEQYSIDRHAHSLDCITRHMFSQSYLNCL